MAKVEEIGDEKATSWEFVRERLLGLPDEQSVSLYVDGDTSLIVLHVAAFGFFVTGCGEGEKDYFTLIEPSLSDDPVSFFDGGNTQVVPRYIFVPTSLLLKATEYYYQTGQRHPECKWVLDRDASY